MKVHDIDSKLIDKIEVFTSFRIHNAVYEDMTVAEKSVLIQNYRMISLNDPTFNGYWLLIPRADGSDQIDWFGEGDE
jgi:hypothetical protein